MQIFLSYAAENKDIAEPIAFSLRARGHKVFFDRDDLPSGGEYDKRIQKAVERSALFVFLLSPAAIGKGRFTLTELEFARHKWRKADGHVLPVMVKPTRFEEIPNFLKSVTVLEPKGNIAAEVAAAVDPLVQSAAGGQMLVYGGLGVISGLITFRLREVLEAIFRPLSLNVEVQFVSLAEELSGIAFGTALVSGFAYFFQFKNRQLLIMPFVLAGWFLAMQTVILGQMVIWGNYTTPDSEQAARCADPQEIDDADPQEIDDKCKVWRAQEIAWRAKKKEAIWAWLTAGAIGAMGPP